MREFSQSDSLNAVAKWRLQKLRKSQNKKKKNTPSQSQSVEAVVTATKHAYKRARERMGWKKSSVERMLIRALRSGIRINKFSGEFGRYLSAKCKGDKSANTVIIYGEVMFFFCNYTLITLYQVPSRFSRYLRIENPLIKLSRTE